jgi:hypothetical protein
MDIHVNNILVVNDEEMRPLVRTRHRRENKTKTDIRDIEWEGFTSFRAESKGAKC